MKWEFSVEKKKIVVACSEVVDGNMSFVYGDELKVGENRRRWFESLGLGDKKIEMQTGLSGDVLAVDEPGIVEADGVVTKRCDTPLLLLTADCYPVVLVSDKSVGLLHCGWRNVDEGVLDNGFDLMDGRLELIWVGPGIARESYVVKNPSQLGDVRWKSCVDAQTGGYLVDIKKRITKDAKEAGVARVCDVGIDTMTDGRFFSRRKCKATGLSQKRFLTSVWKE